MADNRNPGFNTDGLRILGAALVDTATLFALTREPVRESDIDTLRRLITSQLGDVPPSMLAEVGSAIGLGGIGGKAARRHADLLRVKAAKAFLTIDQRGGPTAVTGATGGWDAVVELVVPESRIPDALGADSHAAVSDVEAPPDSLPERAVEALGMSIVRSAVSLWAVTALDRSPEDVVRAVVLDRYGPRRIRSVALRCGYAAPDGSPAPWLESLARRDLPAATAMVAAELDLGAIPTGGHPAASD